MIRGDPLPTQAIDQTDCPGKCGPEILKSSRPRSLCRMNAPLTVPTISSRSPAAGDSFALVIIVISLESSSLSLESGPRQKLDEAIERAAPAAEMRVALLDRLERRLAQRQPGLDGAIFKGHRHYGFVAGRAAFIFVGVAEDQALGLDDLAKDSTHPVFAALGRKHAAPPGAARPQVHLAGGQAETARTVPMDQMLRVGPGFEHEASRCVKDALDNQHPFLRFRGGVGSGSESWFAFDSSIRLHAVSLQVCS